MIISIFDPHVRGIQPIIEVVDWSIYYENNLIFLEMEEKTFPCTDMTLQYIYVGF